MSATVIDALYGPNGFYTVSPPPDWWDTVDETKAPFPWFGGKSRVAEVVWERFGETKNYVEPFAGSLAVLLGRPHAPTIETVNDFDAFVANFQRALAGDPDKVAEYADWPVNETDLHSRHKWLVARKKMLRARLFEDPAYFDARIAGWWIWGLCAWIGSGWCSGDGKSRQVPDLGGTNGGNGTGCNHGKGVHAKRHRLPSIGGGNDTDHPRTGRGVLRKANRQEGQLPHLGGTGMDQGRGVHSKAARSEGQLPELGGGSGSGDSPKHGTGVHSATMRSEGHLPKVSGGSWHGAGVQAGTGVHGQKTRSRLVEVFRALANRMRFVRVTCGDFERILSESVTWRHGTTGVFLDPPYPADAGSMGGIYDTTANERDTFDRAFRYCIANGADKRLRIALCYYEGTTVRPVDVDGIRVEGPAENVSRVLKALGWDVVEWKAAGGYAGQSSGANENAARERVAFSPYCLKAWQAGLFDGLT